MKSTITVCDGDQHSFCRGIVVTMSTTDGDIRGVVVAITGATLTIKPATWWRRAYWRARRWLGFRARRWLWFR
jgi:hypothetical protein